MAIMHTSPRLDPGNEIRCPHCDRWHRIARLRPDSPHPFERETLIYECPSKGVFGVGLAGHESRYPTRRPLTEDPGLPNHLPAFQAGS